MGFNRGHVQQILLNIITESIVVDKTLDMQSFSTKHGGH